MKDFSEELARNLCQEMIKMLPFEQQVAVLIVLMIFTIVKDYREKRKRQ